MAHGQEPWAAGQAQVPVWIRIESAGMAGQYGPKSLKLPMIAQVGDQRTQLQAGDNPLSLPPGVWPVHVWCLYYGIKTGRAELTVDTRAGQPVLLYYMPPRTIYNRGVLSHQPAEREGKSTLALIYTLAPLLVVTLVIVAALLTR